MGPITTAPKGPIITPTVEKSSPFSFSVSFSRAFLGFALRTVREVLKWLRVLAGAPRVTGPIFRSAMEIPGPGGCVGPPTGVR